MVRRSNFSEIPRTTDPKVQNDSYSMQEDEITVLKLHWNDVDTHRQNVQVYITEFPKHGDLYQVLESVKSLNRTGESLNRTGPYNFSAKLLDPEKCITTAPNCSTGNCDEQTRVIWCSRHWTASKLCLLCRTFERVWLYSPE